MSFTVSWVILTFNRSEKVERSIRHNWKVCGDEPDEIIWVDNNSKSYHRSIIESTIRSLRVPSTTILLHPDNLGVAKGYNNGMVLADGDYIVITGCDMLMPPMWLKKFKDYIRMIPHTGVASMYSCPLSEVPERIRGTGKIETHGGLPFIKAMPIGRRIFSKQLLNKIGYFREDLGLYGWEDVIWGHTAERVCDELGLLYYVIPDEIAYHLGTEGINEHDGQDEAEYHAFKQREVKDPNKLKIMAECREKNWPYYNPYSSK